MSLRKKTLLAIGLTSVGLLALLLVLSQIILLRGFNTLQEEAVQQNMLRIHNVIATELDNLNSFVGDWAYWDDTYQYIQDKNEEYATSNLNDGSISNLRVNFFLYTDMNNRTVFGEGFDLKENKPLPMPPDLEPQSNLLRPVLDLPTINSDNKGIILSADGPLLIVGRPILTSQRTGPAAGKVVFGRLLDAAKINAFAEQTQLTIDIRPIDSADLPAGFAEARTTLLAADAPNVVYSLQNQTADGYGLLNDITGKPALLLKMEMPNSIYQQGLHTTLYFAVAIVIAGLTFGTVVIWLLEKIVLARLNYLNNRVYEIASNNKLSERIEMAGNDELSSLTTTINNSLGFMEKSQIDLQKLNLQLEEKIKDLNDLQNYRDRFFTNASHEFRTPMAVLRTQLYLAQKQPALWQKHLDILNDTTNRLSSILNDVFEMAQFKRQNGTLRHQKIEFKSLVTRSISTERPNTYKQGVQLLSVLPDHDIYIQGDQSILEQAVDKLLSFSISYCRHGSEIFVSLSPDSINGVNYACLEIYSLGLQLAESDLAQIFLPFYKSSEGNIRNTGLQLSIAKEITELHNGKISAELDAQKGVCFCIMLPSLYSVEGLVADTMRN